MVFACVRASSRLCRYSNCSLDYWSSTHRLMQNKVESNQLPLEWFVPYGSRLCCLSVKSKLPDVFIPTGHIAVGAKGGLEAAIHALSKCIKLHGNNKDLCCSKLILPMSLRNAVDLPSYNNYMLSFQRSSHGVNGLIIVKGNYALANLQSRHLRALCSFLQLS